MQPMTDRRAACLARGPGIAAGVLGITRSPSHPPARQQTTPLAAGARPFGARHTYKLLHAPAVQAQLTGHTPSGSTCLEPRTSSKDLFCSRPAARPLRPAIGAPLRRHDRVRGGRRPGRALERPAGAGRARARLAAR